MNTKGLLYPNPCPHCGKENTKKGCYEFFGKQNGRKYGVCMRGASPALGWEQAYESNGKTPRGDRAGNSVYQEIIPYEQNGGKKNTNKKLEDTYYYPDKADNPLIKIDCYRDEDGEKYPYAYRYTSNGEWKSGYKDYISRSDIPIYRYGDIRSSIESGQTIWIVEGEKCVERLWKMGIFATCNIGGAGTSGNKWKPSDTACLDGAKEIILCPDQDKPGILHMEAIYKQLLEYGFSDSSIKWLYVYPDSIEWDNIPEAHGLDIFDWIEDGATYQQVISSVREKRTIVIPETPLISVVPESTKLELDNSIIKTSLSQTEYKTVREQVNALYYHENGKPKNIDHTTFFKALYTIYGNRLKYNLQTFEPWLGDKSFKETEGDLSTLYLKLRYLYALPFKKDEVQDAILLLANQNQFHPVKDYLRRCAETVEPIAIDNLASRYFGVDTELANKYLELWLLGGAARPLYPGCDMRHLLILQGRKEQIGKTTFFKILGGEHFSDSLGSSKGKDEFLILGKSWILEYGEIETMWGKKEIGEIKRFISGTEDTFRIPYGKSVETHKRRCIFCGTCNEEEFLKDPTGNTRFWVIPVSQNINLNLLERERDAIWSMATRRILEANPEDVMKGKLWHLPEHLLEANTENTKQYVVRDEWESIIQDTIESHGSGGILFPDIVWNALEIDDSKDRTKLSTKISKIMTKLGWRRSKKRRRTKDSRVYLWIENSLSEEDVDAMLLNIYGQ